MTVELMVVFPVVVVIALIAVNASVFFSQCAEFDRLSRNAARIYAASTASGQDLGLSISSVENAIASSMELDASEYSVTASQDASGCVTFRMSLFMRPTLFGYDLREEFFGVSLPSLSHTTSIVLCPYKPGMFF